MRKNRIVAMLAGALAVAAVGPSSAFAAVLKSGSETALGGNHRITFSDANPTPGTPYAGETNTVTISFDAGTGNYIVKDDTAAITIPTATNNCQLFSAPGAIPSVAACRGTIGTSQVRALTVNAGNNADKVTNDTSLATEINGGNGDDTILGGSGNDVIKPGGGKDSVDARGGDDDINTSGYNATTGDKGDPDTVISCGPGNDKATIDVRDAITDRASCETIVVEPVVTVPPGQPQPPVVIPTKPAVAQSPTGTSAPKPPVNTPKPAAGACGALFVGSAIADRFVGNEGGDKMFGRAGNDLMNGFGGDDCLYGEAGNDRINAGAGKDIAVGGTGRDVVNGGVGNDKLYGQAGNDRLYGRAGADRMSGGTGNDRIWGDAGNDVILGGSGKDVISVGSGSNIVNAGSGNDKVNARNGRRDVIRCGSGRDTVRADRKDRLVGCERRS